MDNPAAHRLELPDGGAQVRRGAAVRHSAVELAPGEAFLSHQSGVNLCAAQRSRQNARPCCSKASNTDGSTSALAVAADARRALERRQTTSKIPLTD